MSNFAKLQALIKGKPLASLDEEQNENSGVEVAPEGEDEGDGADTSGDGDGDEADDAGTSGNDGGEGSGEDGEGEGAGDPAPAPDAQAVDVKSASYAAGFAAANDRWAGMLLNANCRSNMDLAVNLLTTTDLSAEQIGHACSLSAVDPAARKLLESTPKVNVAPNGGGTNGDGTDDDSDAGKAARKAAVERVNKRRSGANKKGS